MTTKTVKAEPKERQQQNGQAKKLPDGWRWVKLGDVADFKNGINFTSDQKGQGLLTVDVLNMYSDDLFIRTNDLYRVDIEPSKDYFLKPDDVLFVRSSVKREGVGWTALCPDLQEPTTFCGFIIRARLTTPELVPEFLAHYCRATFVREELISKSGTGTITNISQSQLKTLDVPLPPLDEQKRIVGILSDRLTTIETARQATAAQLEAAEALPAAYLRQVFDSPEAQTWETKPLDECLVHIQAGKSVNCVEVPASLDEWGVLKVSAVSWQKFDPTANKVLPPDFVPSPDHEVKPGDLLISRANTTELVGAVVLVRETRPRLMLSDKTLRLDTKPQKVVKEYLEVVLRERQARAFIEENATGTSDSMKNISQKLIRKVPVLLPPLETQKSIARSIQEREPSIEKMRKSLQDQLDTINALPASLLRQAFNGQL